ncbi:BAG domain-containing protein Samui-like isoform X2 [Tenebrio molitor]|uniref:BAG domain-containing protein Samui-like isoform X2 n=1 Tax=Tenebrio molitor TaxID=7067 RepID=UPI00362480A3
MPFSRPAFSGFPFDRTDRDQSLRSQLDDLAQRHPEFAEHLEGFPFSSDSLGRRTRPPRAHDSDFRRFTDRHFSPRFEEFGFAFDRDPFDEYRQEAAPPQHTQSEPARPAAAEETQKKTPERGRKQNIQQSNTVDLGQKQEPVNDRNQRSMSAPPPDNRQRFVSSIHIPINRDGGMGDMGTAQSQPSQQEKPANKSTERVIPIHVEGRDEPVLPKHAGPSFSQAQPERIFGHRPGQFTQFVGREPPRQYSAGPEWHHPGFAQKPQPQQKPQEQQKQQEPVPPPQQQQVPQQQQQPPQPRSAANNPIDVIQSIQKDVSELMGQVEQFTGVPRDKQYIFLDEMLTRNLIKLDNVDTQGQENIRQARKEAIKCIESCIGILEAKAAANVPKEEKPPQTELAEQTEREPQDTQQQAVEKMEVEVKEEPPKSDEKAEEEVKAEEAKPVEEAVAEEKMEVVAEPQAPVVTEEKKEEPKEDKVEIKADEEMKEAVTSEESKKEEEAAAKETSQQEEKEEPSDEKKEKKKGKKKIVKNN